MFHMTLLLLEFIDFLGLPIIYNFPVPSPLRSHSKLDAKGFA